LFCRKGSLVSTCLIPFLLASFIQIKSKKPFFDQVNDLNVVWMSFAFKFYVGIASFGNFFNDAS